MFLLNHGILTNIINSLVIITDCSEVQYGHTLFTSSVKAFATTSVWTGPGQTNVTPILCSFTSIRRASKYPLKSKIP